MKEELLIGCYSSHRSATDPEVFNKLDKFGRTPMHVAVANNQMTCGSTIPPALGTEFVLVLSLQRR